jgi:hypothetical protein
VRWTRMWSRLSGQLHDCVGTGRLGRAEARGAPESQTRAACDFG